VAKKKQKERRAIDMLVEVPQIEIPYHVCRVFSSKELTVLGDQVALSNEGDFVYLNEARAAVEWYVKQLGGVVAWEFE
jgi:hypothetical protein